MDKHEARIRELSKRTILLKPQETPWAVVVTYSICLEPPETCGWEGWILEGVFNDRRGATGFGYEALPSKTDQVCYSCGGTLYRMEKSMTFTATDGLRDDLPGLRPGIGYEVGHADDEEG